MFRWDQRKYEFKAGATGVCLEKTQFTAVIFNYSPADRETQSRAARFSRKKWLEYPILAVGGDSGPGVLNLNRNTRVAVEAGHQPQSPLIGRDQAHCLNSVFDQVQNNLLDLCMRGVYLRNVLLIFGGSGDSVDTKLILNRL